MGSWPSPDFSPLPGLRSQGGQCALPWPQDSILAPPNYGVPYFARSYRSAPFPTGGTLLSAPATILRLPSLSSWGALFLVRASLRTQSLGFISGHLAWSAPSIVWKKQHIRIHKGGGWEPFRIEKGEVEACSCFVCFPGLGFKVHYSAQVDLDFVSLFFY